MEKSIKKLVKICNNKLGVSKKNLKKRILNSCRNIEDVEKLHTYQNELASPRKNNLQNTHTKKELTKTGKRL